MLTGKGHRRTFSGAGNTVVIENCQLYTQDARSLLSDRRASRLRQLARPEVSGPRPLSLQRKTWRGQIRSRPFSRMSPSHPCLLAGPLNTCGCQTFYLCFYPPPPPAADMSTLSSQAQLPVTLLRWLSLWPWVVGRLRWTLSSHRASLRLLLCPRCRHSTLFSGV